MLLLLAQWLSQFEPAFTVFGYLTFRTILSTLTALVIALVVGPGLIDRLTRAKVGQNVRDDGPRSHLSKTGTPTMGGALILVAITVATLLWGDLANRQVWVALLVTLGFGWVGGIDDYRKLVYGSSKGLSAAAKYTGQSGVALAAAAFLFYSREVAAESELIVPFFKSVAIPLGLWFIPFVYLVVVGSSNAVNLTDGLDGLAILPTVMVAGALGVIAYAVGHSEFSAYLHIPFIPGAGELIVFAGALVGAGLGFLWFNTYPAQVFMGDVGALALGAALGVLAVMARHELVLVVMGGVFVVETLSVIVQVASYKLTGRRVLRMAPLHHHYELKGWPEPRVIVRFWIITVVLVLVGLATLKLR